MNKLNSLEGLQLLSKVDMDDAMGGNRDDSEKEKIELPEDCFEVLEKAVPYDVEHFNLDGCDYTNVSMQILKTKELGKIESGAAANSIVMEPGDLQVRIEGSNRIFISKESGVVTVSQPLEFGVETGKKILNHLYLRIQQEGNKVKMDEVLNGPKTISVSALLEQLVDKNKNLLDLTKRITVRESASVPLLISREMRIPGPRKKDDTTIGTSSTQEGSLDLCPGDVLEIIKVEKPVVLEMDSNLLIKKNSEEIVRISLSSFKKLVIDDPRS